MWILRKIPIHPTFFLLFLWFIISGKVLEFLVFFIVLLVHEFGHYIVAKKVGYRLDSFYLAPYGVALNYKDNFFDSKDEIKIALAGPCFNLIFALLLTSLWWNIPVSYNFTKEFVFQSVMLALFNLLPAFPLDGGRVFINLFSEKFSRKKMLKIATVNNYIFAGLFFMFFIITCFYDCNLTLILGSIFLLSGGIQTKQEGKYEASYFFKKNVKNLSKIKIIYVEINTKLIELLRKIERNKYIIFYIIDEQGKANFISEKAVLNWGLKFPLDYKINQIIIKK